VNTADLAQKGVEAGSRSRRYRPVFAPAAFAIENFRAA
jgi:hypothetical protein